MERGVEHGNVLVSQVREGFQRFRDADQVSWVVQWCKRHGIFDTLQNFVVDHGGSGKLLAAVHDAVADSGQLRRKLWFLCQNSINNEVQRFAVCSAGPQGSFVFGAVHFPLDASFRQVETLGQTGEEFVAVNGIDDGEFQRRTAAVKNQY